MPNIRYPDRTCMDCGNSEEQCECDAREKSKIDAKIDRMRIFFLEHKHCSCFDCLGLAHAYMLKDETWQHLMPEHDKVRAALWAWYETTQPENFGKVKNGKMTILRGKPVLSVRLCFVCAQKRLKRGLTIEDFSPAPINEDIRFGHSMGRRELLAEMADNSKEIDG